MKRNRLDRLDSKLSKLMVYRISNYVKKLGENVIDEITQWERLNPFITATKAEVNYDAGDSVAEYLSQNAVEDTLTLWRTDDELKDM